MAEIPARSTKMDELRPNFIFILLKAARQARGEICQL
jgi:hypothetical protein